MGLINAWFRISRRSIKEILCHGAWGLRGGVRFRGEKGVGVLGLSWRKGRELLGWERMRKGEWRGGSRDEVVKGEVLG